MSMNLSALQVCSQAVGAAERLRIATHSLPGGGRVLDFGCNVPGGMQAGRTLARICMSGMADITIHPAVQGIGPWPIVQVATDHPLPSCMGSQYAGWKISVGDFFAMGSGPMRARRGGESVLERYSLTDHGPDVVGVLECDSLPSSDVVGYIAQQCSTTPEHVTLCIAPTRSLAGVIQVVARSIETALHKLFELGFDLTAVVAGHGTAPLPPIAKDFVEGIGRTNDAILYGGHVTLWVDGDDEELRSIGPRVPSRASRDYGRPFAKIFKDYHFDFYQVDPGLFAPAVVTLVNQRTGNAFRFGAFQPSLLGSSFGEESD